MKSRNRSVAPSYGRATPLGEEGLREALRSSDHALSHLECFMIGEGNLLLIKQVRAKNRAALSQRPLGEEDKP